MRLVVLAAASLMATTAAAHADTANTVTGTVRIWMPEQRILELNDGQQFSVTPMLPADLTIRPGMDVEVIYDDLNGGGDPVATQIRIA